MHASDDEDGNILPIEIERAGNLPRVHGRLGGGISGNCIFLSLLYFHFHSCNTITHIGLLDVILVIYSHINQFTPELSKLIYLIWFI